jgi:hypothetical protein
MNSVTAPHLIPTASATAATHVWTFDGTNLVNAAAAAILLEIFGTVSSLIISVLCFFKLKWLLAELHVNSKDGWRRKDFVVRDVHLIKIVTIAFVAAKTVVQPLSVLGD